MCTSFVRDQNCKPRKIVKSDSVWSVRESQIVSYPTIRDDYACEIYKFAGGYSNHFAVDTESDAFIQAAQLSGVDSVVIVKGINDVAVEFRAPLLVAEKDIVDLADFTIEDDIRELKQKHQRKNNTGSADVDFDETMARLEDMNVPDVRTYNDMAITYMMMARGTDRNVQDRKELRKLFRPRAAKNASLVLYDLLMNVFLTPTSVLFATG